MRGYRRAFLIGLVALLTSAGSACAAAFEARRPSGAVTPTVRPAALGRTYHVRADGDDNADGLTPETAWATIDRVNGASLGPGDRVLFRSSDRFEGSIRLGPENAIGAADAPFTIGSFGGGRATLQSGVEPAIVLESVSGVRIEDLRLVGNVTSCPFGIEGAHGVHLINERGAANGGVTVTRTEISGFCAGIAVVATGDEPFTGLAIDGVDVHDNLTAGALIVAAEPDANDRYSLRDVTIVDSRFAGSPGVPTTDAGANITGGGIFIYRGERVIVENSIAIDNGGKNACTDGGSAGSGTSAIVLYGRDLTVRGNEVARQRVAPVCPWQGGGIVAGGQRILVERNYTHDNDGPGIALDNDVGDGIAVIRHNVSLFDGAISNDEGAIAIVGGDGNYQILNNTIRTRRGPGFFAQGSDARGAPKALAIENNIVAIEDGALLAVDPTSVDGIAFRNNLYHDRSGRYIVQWGHEAYAGIEPWRQALDQERADGPTAPTAIGDPLFCGATAETLDRRPFATLAAARTAADSSARESSRAPPTPLIAGESRDFAGRVTPLGALDRGAVDLGGAEGCG